MIDDRAKKYTSVRSLAMIPITVFTGFLGAGKTSIILSLLPKLPKDYSVVLLKNEFGDVEGAYTDRDPLWVQEPTNRV
jgi:Ni2+-binding GTPase involved in maturation of urease and hydrogenase